MIPSGLPFLDGLNESQKRAVTTTGGPVLVLAGPGTGKTLTIVRRIACLVHQGVDPENILAVTFTNRAAREMRERTDALLGNDAAGIFIGTFHLLGLRMLRDTLPHDFTVYDRDGQVQLLKTLQGGSVAKARQAADRISEIKGLVAAAAEEFKAIYEAYQAALTENSAVDFDDLILKPVEALGNSDLLNRYRGKFTHLIIDEYQDINPAQYRLMMLLAGSTGNVCAVGDADQAIYSFRGADVRNFLNFRGDFEGAQTIILSENYRSTGTVLAASDALIKNNRKRIERTLDPVRERGGPVTVISTPDERSEGDLIVREIETRIGGTSHYQLMHTRTGNAQERSYGFSDFAVIFRTNAQAKAIEEAFIASGIPYQVIGRQGSLQRKEIEDTLSYLKAIIDPHDDAAPGPALSNEAKLLTPADLFDPRANAVTLMTLHMAKGLEFRVVFITGVEEGIVPYTVTKDCCDIEEERRLFYVGMTRAKDELFLTHARSRFLYGRKLAPGPSPFLREIPGEFVKNKFIPDKIRKGKKDDQIGLF